MKIKSNSGATIQGIADTIMWIGIIVSFFGCIFLVGIFAAQDDEGALLLGLLLGVILFAVGCLISWLSTRLMHGFGEVVQYTAEAATYLEELATVKRPVAVSAVGKSGVQVGANNYESNPDFQIEGHVLTKYTGSGDTAVIPYSTIAIGSYAFANCSHLANVIIPETVETIRDGAFFRCADLAKITLMPGVTSIDLCAFAECPNLTDVFIPKSVVRMGDFIFRDSPKVTIHGYPGSCAEMYAKKNNIPFMAEVEG